MRKHFFRRSFTIYIFALCALAIFLIGNTFAKSVYLSADHHTGEFDAWNINPDGTVTYQATYNLNYATDPAGIGIDVMNGGNDPLMFVSTEGIGGIEVINPVTLQYHGVAPGPVNMGGVDVDDINNILFAIQRGTSGFGGSGTSELYIYTYNDDGSGITQQAHITVPNHGYGMGLAFDDLRDVLWIGDIQYSMVKAYRPDNPAWTAISEDTSLSFNVSHQPVDIAVDRKRNIVYTGGAWLGSTLLTKFDVNAGIESSVDTGFGIMGLTVDESTGYVYVTRGGSYGSGGGEIQVWDCSTSPFTLIQDTPDIGNPAGIAIGNVSYNPMNLAKNDTIQGYGVHIGQTFTYEITYDNQDNVFDITNVTVVDTLPAELDYVSSTPAGVYDAVAHTVTWDIGALPAGDPGGLIELVVRVNQNAVGASTIYNYCTIDSDQTPPTTEEGKDPDNPEPGEPGTYIVPNRPPVAVCQNVTVMNEPGECSADASVDAGSYDPDGDPIVIVQTPAGPYPVGTTEVTLTVTDDKGLSDNCTATVTVEDKEAPVITADLVPVSGSEDDDSDDDSDDEDGRYKLEFSATDNCEGNLQLKAFIKVCGEKVPVANGQEIEIEQDDDCEIEWDDGMLEIEAQNLCLEIKAKDQYGNKSTVTVCPLSTTGGDDDSDDDQPPQFVFGPVRVYPLGSLSQDENNPSMVEPVYASVGWVYEDEMIPKEFKWQYRTCGTTEWIEQKASHWGWIDAAVTDFSLFLSGDGPYEFRGKMIDNADQTNHSPVFYIKMSEVSPEPSGNKLKSFISAAEEMKKK